MGYTRVVNGVPDQRDIEESIEFSMFDIVFQPVVHYPTCAPVGYEALSRFDHGPGPADWFAAAGRAGLGPDLEHATAALAVTASDRLPEHCWVSINASPSFILSGRLGGLVDRCDRRVVVEVTENAPVADYPELREALDRVDCDVAIDDCGAGWASMLHVAELSPRFVKLDRGWMTDLRRPHRRSVIRGLSGIADEIGADLVAEGVETAQVAEALPGLLVRYAQGWMFPAPPAQMPSSRGVHGSSTVSPQEP